jgi:muramoyltetrapeptide carboxypeptidase
LARKPVIHITSAGGSSADEPRRLGYASYDAMIAAIQQAIGDGYKLRGSKPILTAPIDEQHGGRDDDTARVRDIERALSDNKVAALVCLRGGAWFLRILHDIDFDVLRKRSTRLFVFGFSEMTPLVNITGRYRQCTALYDLSPAFLRFGMKQSAGRPVGKAQYRTAFLRFFQEVVHILGGRGSPRVPKGRVMTGSIHDGETIRIVGGNLTLLATMLGSKHVRAIRPRHQWLAIEDINEPLYRIDRYLAALKLAGFFEQAAGLMVGDFSEGKANHGDAVLALLRHHMPVGKRLPIIQLDNVGHVWPMAPLPLHRPVTLRGTKRRVRIETPWDEWTREK